MIGIPSVSVQTVMNYLYDAYNYLVQAIAHVLQITLFQADPSLAIQYATLISYLIPLTAVYLILVFVSAFRKILGYIIAAGWGFIILMLVLSRV